MANWLIILIVVYGAITFVAGLTLLLMLLDGYRVVVLKDIWKLKCLNWFGKTLATIGFFVAVPWWAIIDIFIILMTIGTNKEK